MTLNEVIEGLRKGRSFYRPLDGETETGNEYLVAINEFYCSHTVSGMNALGGWGCAGSIEIKELQNGRWDIDGWRPYVRARAN